MKLLASRIRRVHARHVHAHRARCIRKAAYKTVCKTTRKTVCVCMLAFATFAIFTLCGCSGQPTDNAGGIDSQTTEKAANDNLVNTSQLPDSSFIYDAQIADLQNADSYMDGQTVQVTGEVVGDRIVSDYSPDYCWITLQATDGSYAEISIYMPVSSTAGIDTYGAYGKRGTILQVRGTLWLARADHEGATELEASNVTVVSKGITSQSPVEPMRFIVGIALLLIGGGLSLLYWHLSERRR